MLVACYGSLKKGFYNHECLGDDAEFLGTSKVYDTMYWNGSYPKLYHHNEEHDSLLSRNHELEIYHVGDEAYKGIRAMEVGAGYDEEDIDTEWGTAKIYYMPHANFVSNDRWIEGYTKELFAN